MTLARLHESDASMAALAEELAQLSAAAHSARGEADRLLASRAEAEEAREANVAGLAELEHRLELAQESDEEVEPDPAERDRLDLAARAARAAEMDARLALRTMEERVRALAGRAEALRAAAEQERQARARAVARWERMRREATIAAAVVTGATWLAARVERSLRWLPPSVPSAKRRGPRPTVRWAPRGPGSAVWRWTSSPWSTPRTATRWLAPNNGCGSRRLTEKAREELGLDPESLTVEYGPENGVPVLTGPDGTPLTSEDEQPEPVPYVREEQQKRLRTAERELAVLGRINPLALEEFDALEERHRFLSEQFDDLKRTKADLADIIADVDERVQQVFAEAYEEVAVAFERVFARLFPGGEGRLILTDPGDWLNTGIDVEARPPGKKIKRLSLLSGGERSLVAVAFLVALFIARPSPFYILDEVEAALDDTNLGRLLEIYEELRVNSQLLVITHQKRTMEIADALYGVTMRGDGVTAVISQRLRESSVA